MSVLVYRSASARPIFYAASGYWLDIQTAVDEAHQNGGGDVVIPEGTFNFVNVGESWTGAKVIVPAGVNIFGAPTQRTSGLPYNGVGMNPNGQVVEWKTILQIPWEANTGDPPSYITMFKFEGSSDVTKPSRFSDIKVVGYREFEPTSKRWYSAVQMWNIIDFRVDHCFFKHKPHQAVNVRASANGNCCGVIDHCKFINEYGYVEWDYKLCTVGYGVTLRAVGNTRWEDDITKVIGQYTSSTVFIEDCYFSRWRHCICCNDGLHYVFRHNTLEKDSIVGSLDGHGAYDYVGTRAMEIYNNLIIDPVMNKHPENWDSRVPANGGDGITINWRGGGGVFFNNYVRNYKFGVYMTDEGTVQKCYPHNIWIWNNTWVNIEYETFVSYQQHYRVTKDVDYFLRAPNQEQDGFEYTPYPYPFVTEEPPPPPKDVTPWTGELEEGLYRITMPAEVVIDGETYRFVQWEDGTTDPARYINVPGLPVITATYELGEAPPKPPIRLVESLVGAGVAGTGTFLATRSIGYAAAAALVGGVITIAVTVKLTREQLDDIPLLYPE